MDVRTLYLPHSLSSIDIQEGKPHQLVSEIQLLLKAQNFYSGSIHSIYDLATKEALINFQQKENLPPTGIVDAVTYCRLQAASIVKITPLPMTKRADLTLPKANIVITKSARQLTLLNSHAPVRQYPVGIGKSGTPTPAGNFAIALKMMNPGGMLGTRWLGLNYDSYGIHGTNQPWLIGQMVSHGCIRMHNANVEELYALVNLGTPVYIRD